MFVAPLAEGDRTNRAAAGIATIGDVVRERGILKSETETVEEAVAEDEAAIENAADTLMAVPKPLVPAVRELIAKHQKASGGRTR